MNRRMQLAAILLVISMFAAAAWLGEKAVIFPEIAALACGAWVMEKPPWRFTALKVWLSPTMAALTGVAIYRWFHTTPVVMICTAFILVALQLQAFGSAVVPSLSAAILPILTKVDTPLYPLSVGISTGIIALVHLKAVRIPDLNCPALPAENHHLPPEDGCGITGEGSTATGPVPLRALALWLKLSLGIAVVALVAQHTHALFMVAPPLIVTFVELSKPTSALRQKVPQIMALLTLSAVAGVISLYGVYYVLHWPLWASAAITFGSVFFLYQVFSLPFPPAAAIALLPTILPSAGLWQYPWQILLGSSSFLLISLLCFKADRRAVPLPPSASLQ